MSPRQSMDSSETVLERPFRVATIGPEHVADLASSQSLEGVISVTWNRARSILIVTYDAMDTSYEEFTQWLEKRGWVLNRGFLARWRAAFYRFIDGNVRENARASPVCCSRPPPGAGKIASRDR